MTTLRFAQNNIENEAPKWELLNSNASIRSNIYGASPSMMLDLLAETMPCDIPPAPLKAIALNVGFRHGRKTLEPSTIEVRMSLSIKNDETCLLARDLARLTGESMTGAITVALKERIERERRRREADAGVRELLAIGRRCAKSLKPGPSAAEHGDLLYDDLGLPK